MAYLLTILFAVILFACVATLYTEGMWSNAVRLINLVTAALLATNFFEPAARWLDKWQPGYTYFWDFVALWGLFSLFMVVFRLVTDNVSRVKVRFPKNVDQVGSTVFALWIGWVMVCFAMMTLHTAPLAREFFFNNFRAEERMFLGLAPDRQWLGFTQKMSMGSFCRSATAQEWEQEKYVFDPNADFMPKYAVRRADREAEVTKSTGAPKALNERTQNGPPPNERTQNGPPPNERTPPLK